MSTRYVVERVAGDPAMRRIKDTKNGRYLKQAHGIDLWPEGEASAKAKFMNATASTAAHAATKQDKE